MLGILQRISSPMRYRCVLQQRQRQNKDAQRIYTCPRIQGRREDVVELFEPYWVLLAQMLLRKPRKKEASHDDVCRYRGWKSHRVEDDGKGHFGKPLGFVLLVEEIGDER